MKYTTLAVSLLLIVGLAAGTSLEEPDLDLDSSTSAETDDDSTSTDSETSLDADDTVDSIKDTTEETVDKTKETVEKNGDEFEDTIKETEDSTEETNNETWDKIEEIADDSENTSLELNTSVNVSTNNSEAQKDEQNNTDSSEEQEDSEAENRKEEDISPTVLNSRTEAKAKLNLRIEEAKANYLEAKAQLRKYKENDKENKKRRGIAEKELQESRENYQEAEKDRDKLDNATSEREIQSIMTDASGDLNQSFSNSEAAQKTLENEAVNNARNEFYRNLGIITTLFAAASGGGFLYYKMPRKGRSEESDSDSETGE